MAVFFLALLAAAGVTLGGHGAVRLARLSAATRSSPVLLGAAWLGGTGAASIAAWTGTSLAWTHGSAPTALPVAALLLAALATAALRAGRAPVEPTRSFGAVALVIGAAQLAAGPGLVVLALSAATRMPWSVAAGAALGSGAVLTAAWSMAANWEARLPAGILRYGVAALLLAAALWAAVPASG